MWWVFIDGCDMKPQKFETDEEAERFMLAYLGDETICSIPNRNIVRSQLNEAFQNRSQLKEGWGVFPYLTARWIEF